MIQKIKDFFRNLFGLNSQNYLEAPKNEVLQNEILQAKNVKHQYNDFQEQIKVLPDEEKEKALRLQNDYKSGVIEEEDLSEKEFDILSNLYESQIKETKRSIENYKQKILNIQNKLTSNS